MSPNAEFAFNDGWAWQPCGVPQLWNLRQWLTVNPWESQDGPSCHYLPLRGYQWDSPSCWIGDATLAFYGYGSDDTVMLPAAMIIDAATR